MEENSKCILCRKRVPKSETQLHPTKSKIGIQQRILLSWKNECAVTLCEVLLGTASKSFHQYFRTGEFCSSCLDVVRDIDFTWKQIKSLEARMNELSAVIQGNLKTNYEHIEQKTKAEVVEGRISAAFMSNGRAKDVSFLDSYSYDEITEILHAAASKLSFSAIFPPIVIKKELPSFSGDDDEEMLPVEVKLEQDQEECNEWSDISDGDYDNVATSNSADRRRYFSEMQTMKRKRVTRGRKFNNAEVFNDEEESTDKSNDEEPYIQNDSEESETDPEESWSPKLSQTRCPPKKSRRSSAKSIRKRKLKVQPNRENKLECPTCHKMVTRQCFISHQRTHTGERPFVCSDCGNAFNTEGQLWKHSQLMHAKINPNGKLIKRNPFVAIKAANELASRSRIYHCDMCSWKFTWKYRYLRHLKDTHLNKDIKDGASFKFHYCDEEGCSLSFTSLSSLKTHISEAHSPADKKIPIFDCNICQRIFSQQTSLESHVKSHEESNFGCDYCCSTFGTKIEMDQHLPRHTIVFQLSMYCHLCEECGERFSDVDQLRKHITNLHTNTTIKIRRKNAFNTNNRIGNTRHKYFCNICQKPIHNIPQDAHMYSHTHPNGFQCSICPEVFKTPKLLEFHQQRRHNIQPQPTGTISNSQNMPQRGAQFFPNGFQCSKCPSIELTEELLQIHDSLAHRPHKKSTLKEGKLTECKGRKVKCQVCQEFVWKKSLENHMYSHTNPDGFQCSHPNCTVKKRTPKLINYHQATAHNGKDKNHLPAKPREKAAPDKNQCETCGRTYRFKKDLRKHTVRHHPEKHQTTRPHACTFCWNVFASEEERNSHVEETHNGYICSFEGCGKRLKERKRLIAHLNVHYNRKPYECPYCSKGFANDGNCHSHVLMVHTKHRSIRCKLCPDDIGFYVKKDFSKHVQRVHPEIPESEYMSILERKKPDAPVKIIQNKMLQEFNGYPAKKVRAKRKKPKLKN